MDHTSWKENVVPESFATLPLLHGTMSKWYFPRKNMRIDYKKNYHWGILFNSRRIYTITSVRIKSKAKKYQLKENVATIRISTLWGTCTNNVCVSPKIVAVLNLSSQLSPGNSDPSFQEIFFNWNRNSCISYLPGSLHCCKNQQISVQKPRQPVSEDSMKIFEGRSARTEFVQMTGAEISQEFPITRGRADRVASDSVIRSLFQASRPHINFRYISWSTFISWNPWLSCSLLCTTAALLPSLFPVIYRIDKIWKEHCNGFCVL